MTFDRAIFLIQDKRIFNLSAIESARNMLYQIMTSNLRAMLVVEKIVFY